MRTRFVGPAVVICKHPVSPPGLMVHFGGLCRFPYDHSWTFTEGERIPTVVELAYAERFSHERADWCPADPFTFATMTEGDAARESQWTTRSSSNPIEDIRAFWAAYNTPEAEAARRRARWEELCHLARLLERAGHGHLVPPPYRSGT